MLERSVPRHPWQLAPENHMADGSSGITAQAGTRLLLRPSRCLVALFPLRRAILAALPGGFLLRGVVGLTATTAGGSLDTRAAFRSHGPSLLRGALCGDQSRGRHKHPRTTLRLHFMCEALGQIEPIDASAVSAKQPAAMAGSRRCVAAARVITLRGSCRRQPRSGQCPSWPPEWPSGTENSAFT